jgi:hypothetical protein
VKAYGILQMMQDQDLERLEGASPHALLKEDYDPSEIKHLLRPYLLRVKRKGLGRIINDEAKESGEENPIKGFRLGRG